MYYRLCAQTAQGDMDQVISTLKEDINNTPKWVSPTRKAMVYAFMNDLDNAFHWLEIAFEERVVIEQYLLTNIAVKTDFYNRHPALFIYLGKDEKLIRDLNLFHLKNTIKFLAGREKEVKEKVDELINNSMSNYYFEQIGDTIVKLRKNLNLFLNFFGNK